MIRPAYFYFMFKNLAYGFNYMLDLPDENIWQMDANKSPTLIERIRNF